MNKKGGTIIKDDEQKIRDVEPSDIQASVPEQTDTPIIKKTESITHGRGKIPKEVRQRARKRSLASRIRDDHQGDGFVIVNTTTGGVIEVVDDLGEARDVLASPDLSSDNTLIVSCYER